ncbi:MAG TPA: PQQ-binding-like beta-propeller repeat protein [Gaiellaceae bacterium]|nr:PQQ-binding-like beta-propeller repeat protein [Gaiellaceae bacterium]
MRRAAVLLAAGALALAGCGGERQHASTVVVTRTVAASNPQPSSLPAIRHREQAILVAVVDGDSSTRVAGARVSVGGHTARTNRHGVAKLHVARRGAYVTTAAKRGYGTRSVRLPFRTHPLAALRIYRTALQWPLYGATPARTHVQSSMRVRPPFRVVWTRGVGSLMEFPAVVSDGVAYVGNYRETIRAISMRDGSVIWRHDTPHGKMASSLAISGGSVVVHGMDGYVRVLRRSDGHVLWSYRTGSPIESSPIVAHGLDVFGTWSGRIAALDLKTHRVRWSRADGCKITSSAAIVGGTVYIGDYCGRLLALDARTGAPRWTGRVNGRIYGTPAVAAGRVFVPSSTGDSLTAFSTRGRLLWRRGFGSYVYSSPATDHGRVFVGDYGGGFYALSARSGRTLWEVSAGGSVSGAAVVVDGVAYAGSLGHEIVGVAAPTGRVLVRFPHGEYVPVSGSGDRLLLHGYSRLYAVEAKR